VTQAAQKFKKVIRMLSDRQVLVAFSGGVDSSTLALLAKKSARRVVLLVVAADTMPQGEVEHAKTVAQELGLECRVVPFDWTSKRELSENSEERCYNCKVQLGRLWLDAAEQLGLDVVVEGTTTTEAAGTRPGERALRELGITSPFLDAGITKDEIREYARTNGLSVADRPSMACLATRFPYGTTITPHMLEMVEKVETAVRQLFGIECVRARFHNDVVRIEVPPDQMKRMLDRTNLDTLYDVARKAGFKYAALDLRGYRTGSMDE